MPPGEPREGGMDTGFADRTTEHEVDDAVAHPEQAGREYTGDDETDQTEGEK